MYSDIENVINNITGEKVKVKKCFFTKVGGGIFSNSEVCSKEISLEDLKSIDILNDKINIDENELIKALEKNSNIFNIHEVSNQKTINRTRYTHLGKIIEKKPIAMELNLPERLQKYSVLSDVFGEKFVERFKSIINGSTFICYKEIKEFNTLSIGVEFREIYKKIIDDYFDFQFKVQPPCPFRENYYIIVAENESLFKNNGFVSIHKKYSDIYIIVNELFIEKDTSEEELIFFIMKPIINELNNYYHLKSLNMLIDIYMENINELYTECTRNYSELTSVNSYNLLKYNKLKKNLKKQVFLLHNYYLEIESYIYDYDISREKFLENISKNPILQVQYDEFKKETDYENKLSMNLLNILSYFSEELRNYESTRIAIICSIMGASLGATATLLAK